jgi:hypothetical protein
MKGGREDEMSKVVLSLVLAFSTYQSRPASSLPSVAAQYTATLQGTSASNLKER